jgi:large subunit ribosomal protein L4
MQLNLHIGEGALEVGDHVFGADFNETLVHQLVTAYLAGGRAGTKGGKSRSDVSGGGRKPWRQKGTGRARSGTIRSPIWKGGGQTFATHPRDFSQKVNKKQWRAGLRSILSELTRQGRLRLIKEVNLPDHRTKSVVAWLSGIAEGRVLVVDTEFSLDVQRGTGNLFKIRLCEAGRLNPAALVGSDFVVMTARAAESLSESLS